MTRNVRTIAVVIATIVLIVGTYIAYEKYTRRSHVMATLNDTAARLRSTLQSQAAGGAAAGAGAHAAAVDAHLTALRKTNASSFRALADAADDYLLTSREILRRVADIERLRGQLAGDFDALNTHLNGDRGGAGWAREAVRLKQALDKDVRDYRIAAESCASLLQTLPASQAKIAPFVGTETLVDAETIAKARKSTLDAFAAADQNIQKAANLGSRR